MFHRSIIGTLFIVLVTVSINSHAALIEITATHVDSRFSDFTLQYEDMSGDGLLQIDEIVYFSGFTLTNPMNPTVSGNYDIILGIPDIDNISSSSGVNLFASSNWNFKRFEGDTALCCSSRFWTYTSADLSLLSGSALLSVPLPAAIWLFGSGLIALIGTGKRARNNWK